MTLALKDLRFAVRGLVRSPLFSIVAVLSLALGIGANTAIFTLIDQILLRKLPVAAPEQLVVLSYDYWVRRFSRDPAVVDSKILVNNYPMTVVGVSAAGFYGLDPARSPQIRVPIQMKPIVVPEWGWVHLDDPRTRWVQVFAR